MGKSCNAIILISEKNWTNDVHSNMEDYKQRAGWWIYTVLCYLHKVHEQSNYFLVIEIGTVVAMEGRLTGGMWGNFLGDRNVLYLD